MACNATSSFYFRVIPHAMPHTLAMAHCAKASHVPPWRQTEAKRFLIKFTKADYSVMKVKKQSSMQRCVLNCFQMVKVDTHENRYKLTKASEHQLMSTVLTGVVPSEMKMINGDPKRQD
jgi:hypothetical protein